MTVEPKRGSSDPGARDDASSSQWTIPSKSTGWELTPSEQPNDPSTGRHSSQPTESPDALRSRADSLLDEMMLSGVDVSAADQSSNDYGSGPHSSQSGYSSTPIENGDGAHGPELDGTSGSAARYDREGPEFNSAGQPSRRGEPRSAASDVDGRSYGWSNDNGYIDNRSEQPGLPNYRGDYGSQESDMRSHNGQPEASDVGGRSSAGVESGDERFLGSPSNSWIADKDEAGQSFDSSTYQPRNPAHPAEGGSSAANDRPAPTPEWRVLSGGGDSSRSESTWNEYVSSYRNSAIDDGRIQKWQPEEPADYSQTSPSGSDSGRTLSDENDPYRQETERPIDETGQPNHQSTTGDGSEHDSGYNVSGYGAAEFRASDYSNLRESDLNEREQTSQSQSSPMDSEGESDLGYASSMSVLSRGRRRSSLLPRMSRFDVDKLNREIADLHEEIRLLLPVGHDQAERAQHLLDKAHTIAASDPERSAEVEYYMQQVRTIVERTRQSRRWSDLYRRRLRTYLLAWTVLSSMTLIALLIGQFQIEAFVANITGASLTSQFIYNFAGGLGAIMAGALGGSLGALLNMARHARKPYGFFDRKYGLRGLILPLIGALVGLVIYALFGTLYYSVGINPSLSLIAMALPALLAFLFGVAQEAIYGTSG